MRASTHDAVSTMKITNEQIDHLLNNVGGPAAGQYFEACGRWIKANHSTLSMLHDDFEADTKSEIDFSNFCSRMFNETHDGEAAAEKYLRPLLTNECN